MSKRLSGFRFAIIEYGDTLQQIALRELGDANLWRDLIAINDLVPPYLTGDQALAGPQVLLYGAQLVIPSVSIQTSAATDPNRVFGVDLALDKHGRLQAENGDLVLVAGVANLKQAISNRLNTPLKDLLFHPAYGCDVFSLLGHGNDPTDSALAAKFVEGALLADPRIDSVANVTATVSGDHCAVAATAIAIDGTSVDIRETL